VRERDRQSEATLMMRPRPRSRIAGRKRWQSSAGAVINTWMKSACVCHGRDRNDPVTP
jgi:hypothetical protein